VRAHQRESPRRRTEGPLLKHRANGYNQHNADYRHQAPTPAERREGKLLAELRELGYYIAVSCLVCGHPLTSARSVALMVGPRCRAKAVQS
jgi:hypothetical protein